MGERPKAKAQAPTRKIHTVLVSTVSVSISAGSTSTLQAVRECSPQMRSSSLPHRHQTRKLRGRAASIRMGVGFHGSLLNTIENIVKVYMRYCTALLCRWIWMTRRAAK